MEHTNQLQVIGDLHSWHFERCAGFKSIVESCGWKGNLYKKPQNIYLHSGIFKEIKLISMDVQDDILLLKSSGTSGTNRSHIYTDRFTRISQQRALQEIITKELLIDIKDKPAYYVIENPKTIKGRGIEEVGYDARFAAIKGFSTFGKGMKYLLNENNELDLNSLENLRNERGNVFIFGFTASVYLYFIKRLISLNIRICNNDVILLHGGGWKKLEKYGISNSELRKCAEKTIPNIKCVNYYGMIEQTGSIYVECKEGFLHTNNFGLIITRNNNLDICKYGEQGIVQSLSVLPKSYPGQSVLTEDIGIIYGKDDCKCGKGGLYFKVFGRLPKTEIKGCSDVY